MNHRDNLCCLNFRRFIGVSDFFDLFVALLCQTSQIVPKAQHAVIGGAIRPYLDTVLFGDSPRLIFPVTECVAEVVGRVTSLLVEGTRLGVAQQVREVRQPILDVFAIRLGVLKYDQIVVIGPLIANE